MRVEYCDWMGCQQPAMGWFSAQWSLFDCADCYACPDHWTEMFDYLTHRIVGGEVIQEITPHWLDDSGATTPR